MFYTTGEAVRRVLDAETDSPYTPMLYGIFERGDWVDYRRPLETAWSPYLDGARTLSEAATDLVQALRTLEKPPDRSR